jgi:hypothetical protein
MHKERNGKAALLGVVGVGHPMGGAAQQAIGEVLQHIPGIDNDLTREGRNGQPRSISLQKF